MRCEWGFRDFPAEGDDKVRAQALARLKGATLPRCNDCNRLCFPPYLRAIVHFWSGNAYTLFYCSDSCWVARQAIWQDSANPPSHYKTNPVPW